ncbi:sensor histidine kinase [Maridesulfovibrio sp.]|uniref:sensor histidine kinase n=1 Tax=Maridesulfovibrio sp. TaxID=2795000 RepID=UPI003BA9CD4C
MNSKTSIRRSIIILIIVICTFLVLSYSFLLRFYLGRGLDFSSEFYIKRMAREYLADVDKNNNALRNGSDEVHIYSSYDLLPEALKRKYPESEVKVNKFLTYYTDEIGYQLYRFERSDGLDRFLVFSFDERKIPDEVKQWFDKYVLYIPAGLGLLSVGMIVLLAVFLIRRVAGPVEELGRWAGNMDINNPEGHEINFKYEELDQLAHLLWNNMKRLSEGVEREKRFQKYSSHELRTPIAILQNNLELQERLGIEENERLKPSYLRMRKAVAGMRHLTETLLWASRESRDPLPEEDVDVSAEILRTVGENRYLLQSKEVDLKLNLEQFNVTMPLRAFQILLSNIIRNAFQYSFEGEIRILLQQGILEVSNLSCPDVRDGKTESFGLGLQLTTQLAERLGWELNLAEQDERFVVRVDLN